MLREFVADIPWSIDPLPWSCCPRLGRAFCCNKKGLATMIDLRRGWVAWSRKIPAIREDKVKQVGLVREKYCLY